MRPVGQVTRIPEERPRAAPRAKEAEKTVKKEEKPEGRKVRDEDGAGAVTFSPSQSWWKKFWK